jgi:phosphotransferase system enzyme I (PtsI)
MIFQGIAAAPGLAIAKCLRIEPPPQIGANQAITLDQVEGELARFTQAVQQAAAELAAIADTARLRRQIDRAEIIEAQSLIVTDPTLDEGVRQKITLQLVSAVQAVCLTIDEQAAIFAGLEEAYLRERVADVQDVGQRLTDILLGRPRVDLSGLTEAVALVAQDISPSQLATADAAKVRAIVAETGGQTSHTAILANNMGIPAVLGCRGILAAVMGSELLLVNGDAGTVETGLAEERQAAASRELERRAEAQVSLRELIGQPTRTRDGVAIDLSANIMNPAGAEQALQVGADGIGLYRTEFLFMDRPSAPSEEEQLVAYRQVLQTMQGKPVIIRTLDIGGDKDIHYMHNPVETNPFLGYRAIRICLRQPGLFMTQLRAILRASVYGQARIMYPMIASLEEIQAANQILQQAKDSLLAEGLAFDANLPVGMMIEVPSSAVMADVLIDAVDFFSIGSNDLTQYTLAVDRLNENVRDLYNPFQPGVLRLIRMVAEAANRVGGEKFAGICGELAADPRATLLLLGLGLTEFSVNPAALLKIKKIITSVEKSYAQDVAEKAMRLTTVDEIMHHLEASIPAELRHFLV